MAKLKTDVEILFTLELSHREAGVLRAMLQNPMVKEEPESIQEVREGIFNLLNRHLSIHPPDEIPADES